jgi:NAD(P)-dependent dehydrogenase (short-subunit alcohol dehydrogenase family)
MQGAGGADAATTHAGDFVMANFDNDRKAIENAGRQRGPGANGLADPDRRKLIGSALAAGLAAGLASAPRAGLADAVAVGPARRFENKVVVITGATSGIGRAAALAFAAEGAKVGFCGRREALGSEVERQIRAAGGVATYLRADVRREEEVKVFVDGIAARYGRLDVAFNNAGITMEKPLHEFSAEEFDDVLTTNLRGVFFAMKHEIPHMLAAGHGNIVVTSSSEAIATAEHRSVYSASKRGLLGLVQSAALDYADKGIRVNALLPGTTNTALVRQAAGHESMPDALWNVGAAVWARSHVPLKRMATPEEIAAFAVVLASDAYPFMTGSAQLIDGGMTSREG